MHDFLKTKSLDKAIISNDILLNRIFLSTQKRTKNFYLHIPCETSKKQFMLIL